MCYICMISLQHLNTICFLLHHSTLKTDYNYEHTQNLNSCVRIPFLPFFQVPTTLLKLFKYFKFSFYKNKKHTHDSRKQRQLKALCIFSSILIPFTYQQDPGKQVEGKVKLNNPNLNQIHLQPVWK